MKWLLSVAVATAIMVRYSAHAAVMAASTVEVATPPRFGDYHGDDDGILPSALSRSPRLLRASWLLRSVMVITDGPVVAIEVTAATTRTVTIEVSRRLRGRLGRLSTAANVVPPVVPLPRRHRRCPMWWLAGINDSDVMIYSPLPPCGPNPHRRQSGVVLRSNAPTAPGCPVTPPPTFSKLAA